MSPWKQKKCGFETELKVDSSGWFQTSVWMKTCIILIFKREQRSGAKFGSFELNQGRFCCCLGTQKIWYGCPVTQRCRLNSYKKKCSSFHWTVSSIRRKMRMIKWCSWLSGSASDSVFLVRVLLGCSFFFSSSFVPRSTASLHKQWSCLPPENDRWNKLNESKETKMVSIPDSSLIPVRLEAKMKAAVWPTTLMVRLG